MSCHIVNVGSVALLDEPRLTPEEAAPLVMVPTLRSVKPSSDSQTQCDAVSALSADNNTTNRLNLRNM